MATFDVVRFSPVNVQITATNSPDLYVADWLPTGLSINPVTGLITGSTDYGAGGATTVVTASNENGEAVFVLIWNILEP